ncbi:MAG: hypothetical protein ACM3Y9_10065 [Ignavibacteria bacterium]
MAYVFRVRPHPLGVVVSERPETLGELLLPGEKCCGVAFEDLERAAATTGFIEVPEVASGDCPLRARWQRR